MVTYTRNKDSMKVRGRITPLLTSILQHDTIKALSLSDPWGELVALGAKCLETRSWPTEYRGPLAIHVSKKFSAEHEALCSEEPFFSTLTEGGFHPESHSGRRRRNAWQFPLGSIVAVAWLEDVRRIPPMLSYEQFLPEPELSFGNFAPGRFIWVLPMVYRLPNPLPATGSYGLWDWQPPDLFWEIVQTRLDTERQEEA